MKKDYRSDAARSRPRKFHSLHIPDIGNPYIYTTYYEISEQGEDSPCGTTAQYHVLSWFILKGSFKGSSCGIFFGSPRQEFPAGSNEHSTAYPQDCIGDTERVTPLIGLVYLSAVFDMENALQTRQKCLHRMHLSARRERR